MKETDLNPQLKAQIKRFLGQDSELDEPFKQFLKSVSDYYYMVELSNTPSKEDQNIFQNKIHFETTQRIAGIGSWEMDLSIDDSSSNESLYWSDETYRLFGYAPNEVPVNLDLFFKHIPDAAHSLINKTFEDAVNTRSIYQVEHTIVQRDGTERIVEEWGEFIFDPKNGQPLKAIGTVQDITERKENELALKTVSANLKSILENTDTGYLLLNRNREIVSFNHVANENLIKAVGKNIVLGQKYLDLIPDNRKPFIKQQLDTLFNNGLEIYYEVSYKLNDAQLIWFGITMMPVWDENKIVIGINIAAKDITKRKIAEDQLKQFNERYELMTKATNDVLWDWDLINDTIYRSANYQQIFGYATSNSNVYLESLVDPIYPDDKPIILKSVLDKINDPEAEFWEGEYRLFKNNGEIAYVKDKGYIVRDENKKPLRIVGAMHDITKRKAAATERERITQDLIRQNKDLEQFAYIISHNLRAPVANIHSFAEIMTSGTLNKTDQNEILKGLNVSVKNLDGVIKDLNEILQVKREILESRETFKLSNLINDISNSISDLIKKEEVKIETDFSEVDEINSIKSYFNSICYNLITNSIKYKRPEFSPVISIKSQKLGNKLLLTFDDNGLGIDLNTKGDQVFGLYKRFHLNIEGKGMGLFMVKTQIEAIGGKISLESAVNRGTKFSIELGL